MAAPPPIQLRRAHANCRGVRILEAHDLATEYTGEGGSMKVRSGRLSRQGMSLRRLLGACRRTSPTAMIPVASTAITSPFNISISYAFWSAIRDRGRRAAPTDPSPCRSECALRPPQDFGARLNERIDALSLAALGNSTETVRITDGITRTAMTAPVEALSMRVFAQNPPWVTRRGLWYKSPAEYLLQATLCHWRGVKLLPKTGDRPGPPIPSASLAE